MWLDLTSYTVVGGIIAAFATLLVLLLTQCLLPTSTPMPERQKDGTTQKKRRVSLKEHLEKHYTKENLAEIARCAVMMEKLAQERGHGDAESTNKTVDSSSPQSNEEPDIFELLAEDITIEDDEEVEEHEDEISPQARADIEAELLDSSMLSAANSSDDEQQTQMDADIAESTEVPVDKKEETAAEAAILPDEEVTEDEEVLHEDDAINTQASILSNAAICMALSEVGVESIMEGLDGENSESDDSVGKDCVEGGGDGVVALSKYYDMVSKCLVRKSICQARKELKDEQRLSTMCNMCQPTSVQSYKQVVDSLTDTEMQEERQAQESQLSKILELMQQHPDLFGDMSQKEMSEQAALYCV